MFQFQTGSIKRNLATLNLDCVRVFQFQTGSIKSGVCDTEYHKDEFQFQTGSIKSPMVLAQHALDCFEGFNSKLVRLKAGESQIQKGN